MTTAQALMIGVIQVAGVFAVVEVSLAFLKKAINVATPGVEND